MRTVYWLAITLFLSGVIAMITFRVGPDPVVNIKPALPAIGQRTSVSIEVEEQKRGLSNVRVDLVQGDRIAALADRNYPHRSIIEFWGPRTQRDVLTVEVGQEKIPDLRPGEATIRVTAARIGTWLLSPEPLVQEVTLPVRLTPPSLKPISTLVYVAQGGCEAMVYSVGRSSVHDGVRVGKWWFPGYALPGGDGGERFALFAVPYDMVESDIKLVAVDAAANQVEISFIDRFFEKPVRTDTIEVSDKFMSKVVPEILSQTPEFADRGNLLDNFLAINGELRQTNAVTLIELAKQSKPDFLWNKPFQPLPNAKVMSAFADSRIYTYRGRVVDHQIHLGFDLAAVRRTPVPAANDGRVVLAEYFGIYGNAIVIDHGYGLMSFYGHLSAISVDKGESVSRGEIIATTGETGLAGGDHLHFTLLLQGLAVNPIEWWDGHWIRDRIAKKLGPAFPFER